MDQPIWCPGDRIIFGARDRKGMVIRINKSIQMANGEHPIEIKLDGKSVTFNVKSDTLTRIEG